MQICLSPGRETENLFGVALPVQTPWPHLIYLLLQVVPAGWQTLQSQLSAENILL